MSNKLLRRSMPLPSKEEALAYELPDDHPLQGVGVLEQNKDDKKYYIVEMHFINGSGQVVCNCDLVPRETRVYEANKFKPNERWVYCERSVEYLRYVVRGCEAKKKGQSSGPAES